MHASQARTGCTSEERDDLNVEVDMAGISVRPLSCMHHKLGLAVQVKKETT